MTTLVRCAVLLLLSVAAPAHAQHAGHGFSNAERWATQFDDPARDTWQKPDAVIRALAPAPDAVIADIGAGTGYFSVRLARAVPHGKVIGVDIEPDMVRYLAQRAHREGLANLSAQLGAADDPRLPVKVDLVLLVDTYHHIASREDYFRRLRSSLEPSTGKRWLQLYLSHDCDLRVLIADIEGRGGPDGRRLGDFIEQLIDDMIDQVYLVPED